jgi:hypothetical protein
LVAVLHQAAAVQLQPAEQSQRLVAIGFTRLPRQVIFLFPAAHWRSSIYLSLVVAAVETSR